MNKLFLVLLMIGNLAACQAPNQNSDPKVLEPKEFIEKFKARKDALLLDVRTPEEVAEGALEGAQNINFYDADFKDQLSKLDKSKAVFVYCRSGGRSGKCAQMCKDLGFKEVYDMKGGWLNYSSQK